MPDVLSELAEKLAWESTSWSSIELRGSSKEQLRLSPQSQPSPPSNTQFLYIETALGERFRDGTTTAAKKPPIRVIVFFVVRRGGSITFERGSLERQRFAEISERFGPERPGTFTYRPLTLSYRYLIQKPLHLALPSGKESGIAKLLGRDCVKVVFEKALAPNSRLKLDLVYLVDRETGIPLQLEATSDGAMYITWQALSFDAVNGRHLAKSSKLTHLDGKGMIISETQEDVDQVRFDATHPASTFAPKIDPGTFVQDLIQKKMILPKKPAPSAPAKDQAARTESPSPIVAAVPEPGWADSSASLFFGGGLLMITVGVVFILKRWWKG